MRYLFIISAFMFLVGCDTANNVPDPTESYFVKYYGTDGDQESADMLVNNDGTILLFGTSTFSSDGIGKGYLVKVDGRGDVIWETFFSGTGSLKAVDIEPIADGNYVILCNEVEPATGLNILIKVIDANGGEVSSGSFSYPGVSDEEGVTITPILDGTTPAGFLVAGNTNYDPIPNDNSNNGFEKISALIVRFNSDGTLYSGAWTDHQSSNGEDYYTKAVQVDALTAADPFVLFGYTNSDYNNPSFNFWTTRVNNYGGGSLLENGIIPGSPANTDERLGSVSPMSKSQQFNNYLLTGISTSNTGIDNIFIASSQLSLLTPMALAQFDLGSISATGNRILEKVTSYPASGGFVIAANTIAGGNTNIILTKVSNDGKLLWQDPVILGGAGEDYESSVYVTSEGKIFVFGTVSIGDDGQKKLMLIKLNQDGQFK